MSAVTDGATIIACFGPKQLPRHEQILAVRDLILTEDRYTKKQSREGMDGILDKNGKSVIDWLSPDAYRFSIHCAALKVAFPLPYDPEDPYRDSYDINEEILWSIACQMKRLGIEEEDFIEWSERDDVSHQDVIDVLEVTAEMQRIEDEEFRNELRKKRERRYLQG